MKTFLRQLEYYWIAANAAALRGGALAVDATYCQAGAAMTGYVPLPNLRTLGGIFVGAFVMSLVRYVKDNPLPTLPKPDEAT